MYFINKALEYIFLPSCGVCGKLGEGYLCIECGKRLEKYVINKRNKLLLDFESSAPKSFFNSDLQNCNKIKSEAIYKFHIFKYEDLIRTLIIQYKFNDKSYLYKTFCEFIVKNKKSFDFIKSYDIIVPVPIHQKRMKQRGYNQSELIAKDLAKIAQIKCYTNILIKTKNNEPQSTLSGKLRKENTKNVYKLANFEKIYNKKVLIFDDVYTTGATISACIKQIDKASPSKIGVLTLARD